MIVGGIVHVGLKTKLDNLDVSIAELNFYLEESDAIFFSKKNKHNKNFFENIF